MTTRKAVRKSHRQGISWHTLFSAALLATAIAGCKSQQTQSQPPAMPSMPSSSSQSQSQSQSQSSSSSSSSSSQSSSQSQSASSSSGQPGSHSKSQPSANMPTAQRSLSKIRERLPVTMSAHPASAHREKVCQQQIPAAALPLPQSIATHRNPRMNAVCLLTPPLDRMAPRQTRSTSPRRSKPHRLPAPQRVAVAAAPRPIARPQAAVLPQVDSPVTVPPALAALLTKRPAPPQRESRNWKVALNPPW